MEKVLVLLGCGYDEESAKQHVWTLNQAGIDTIAEAIKQLQENHFDAVFVSGGQSVWYGDEKPEDRPDSTEADLLTNELIAQGVPEELLYTDPGKPPQDTIGNAASALAFVRENNVKEIIVLHRKVVQERTRGIYDMVIPENICKVTFVTIPSLYPVDPEELLAQHSLWIDHGQKFRLEKMLPLIWSGEITTENLYNDGAYREETLVRVQEAAKGRMPIAARK